MKLGAKMLFELLRVIIPYLDHDDGFTLFTYFKPHQVVFFKYMQYTVGQLYLREAVKFYF